MNLGEEQNPIEPAGRLAPARDGAASERLEQHNLLSETMDMLSEHGQIMLVGMKFVGMKSGKRMGGIEQSCSQGGPGGGKKQEAPSTLAKREKAGKASTKEVGCTRRGYCVCVCVCV